MNCLENIFLSWLCGNIFTSWRRTKQKKEYQKFWHFYLEKSYTSSDSSISSITLTLSLSLSVSLSHTHKLTYTHANTNALSLSLSLTLSHTLSQTHTLFLSITHITHKSIIKQKWVSKSFIFFAIRFKKWNKII